MRRRKARKERPPQPAKLLRPAGYSSLCHVDDAFDKLFFAFMEAIGAGAIFGLFLGACFGPLAVVAHGLVLRQFSFAQLCAAPKSYMVFAILTAGLAALLWCIRSSLLTFRYEDEIRTWRLGARGEQAVAESLADQKLAAAGYRSFHDVPGDGPWNTDHVVVGPAGVFVIETKACVRRKAKGDQPEHKVIYDGKTLQFPWRFDDRVVKQVESNANWVRKRIDAYAPNDIVVTPVIAVPGWYVEPTGKFPVKAMNAAYLVNYLAGAERRFTPEQLRGINSRLDELCRTLEF